MGFLKHFKQLLSLSLIFSIAHSNFAFAGRHGSEGYASDGDEVPARRSLPRTKSVPVRLHSGGTPPTDEDFRRLQGGEGARSRDHAPSPLHVGDLGTGSSSGSASAGGDAEHDQALDVARGSHDLFDSLTAPGIVKGGEDKEGELSGSSSSGGDAKREGKLSRSSSAAALGSGSGGSSGTYTDLTGTAVDGSTSASSSSSNGGGESSPHSTAVGVGSVPSSGSSPGGSLDPSTGTTETEQNETATRSTGTGTPPRDGELPLLVALAGDERRPLSLPVLIGNGTDVGGTGGSAGVSMSINDEVGGKGNGVLNGLLFGGGGGPDLGSSHSEKGRERYMLTMSLLRAIQWEYGFRHSDNHVWRYGAHVPTTSQEMIIKKWLEGIVTPDIQDLISHWPGPGEKEPPGQCGLFFRALWEKARCWENNDQLCSAPRGATEDGIGGSARELRAPLAIGGLGEEEPLLGNGGVGGGYHSLSPANPFELTQGNRDLLRHMHRVVFENQWTWKQWATTPFASAFAIWAAQGAVPVLLVATDVIFYQKLGLRNKFQKPIPEYIFISWVMGFSIFDNWPRMLDVSTRWTASSQQRFTQSVSRCSWWSKVGLCAVGGLGAASLGAFFIIDAELTIAGDRERFGQNPAPAYTFLDDNGWCYITECYLWGFYELWDGGSTFWKWGQRLNNTIRRCFSRDTLPLEAVADPSLSSASRKFQQDMGARLWVLEKALNVLPDRLLEDVYEKLFGDIVWKDLRALHPGLSQEEHDELMGLWRTTVLMETLSTLDLDEEISEAYATGTAWTTLGVAVIGQAFNFLAFTMIWKAFQADAKGDDSSTTHLTAAGVLVSLLFTFLHAPVEAVNGVDLTEDVLPYVGEQSTYGGSIGSKLARMVPFTISCAEAPFESIPNLLLTIGAVESYMHSDYGWMVLASFYMVLEISGLLGNLKRTVAEKIPAGMSWCWNGVRQKCGYGPSLTYKRLHVRRVVRVFSTLLREGNEDLLIFLRGLAPHIDKEEAMGV